MQAVDGETLMSLATRHDWLIELCAKPGDFIELNQPIVRLWDRANHSQPVASDETATNSELPSDISQKINETIIVGRRRTPRQDPECALEELVEVAVRALSPGINDPFTANACIDRLPAALGRLAERAMPRTVRVDDSDIVRVVTPEIQFSDLVDAAFNPIRQHGGQCVAVAIRTLQALNRICAHTSDDQQRATIRRHAEMLQREFRARIEQPEDGDDFERRYKHLLATLGDFTPEESHQGSQSGEIPATSCSVPGSPTT